MTEDAPRAPEGDSSDPASDPSSGSSGAAVRHTSGMEDPSALAEGLGDNATGDLVIDAALQSLQDAPPDDLDAQIERGQQVQQTLQDRLSDLGGE